MNNEFFYVCNHTRDVKSDKSWWNGYNILWGHRNMGKCEGLLVTENDYFNFLNFVKNNNLGLNKTYKINISLKKKFLGDYWTLSNFCIFNGVYY